MTSTTSATTSSSIIKLQSNDGQVYAIDSKAARLSATIGRLMDALEVAVNDPDPIPLPNVDSTTLKLVIQWAEQHKDDNPQKAAINKLTEWDENWLAENKASLPRLIDAANYLELLDLMYMATNGVIEVMTSSVEGAMKKSKNPPPPALPFTIEEITSLPDVPFLATFARQPNEMLLLKASRVCTKWEQLCRQVARKRTSLTLIVGNVKEPSRQETYRRRWDGKIYDTAATDAFDDFTVAASTWIPTFPGVICLSSYSATLREFIDIALRFFPNINHLVLGIFSKWTSLIDIVQLVEAYANQLVTFKLYANYSTDIRFTNDIPEATNIHRRLLELINGGMPKLQMLTLHCKAYFLKPGETIRLPILKQLDEFCFFSFDPLPGLAQEVFTQGQANLERGDHHQRERPLRLSLLTQKPINQLWEHFPAGNEIADRLLGTIAHVSLIVDQTFLQNINRFESLRALHIGFGSPRNVNWRQFLLSLCPLEQLESIHISKVKFAVLKQLISSGAEDSHHQEPAVILPSVRYLWIDFECPFQSPFYDTTHFTIPDHRLLEQMRLDVSFPSLRKAMINCRDRKKLSQFCNVCQRSDQVPHTPSKVHCLTRLVEPLKRCPDLVEIFVNANDGFKRIGTSADFAVFGTMEADQV